jgi:agmatinase
VRELRGPQFVAFDLVEVSPAYDCGQITALLAATIAYEFLTLLAWRKETGC